MASVQHSPTTVVFLVGRTVSGGTFLDLHLDGVLASSFRAEATYGCTANPQPYRKTVMRCN